MFCVVRNPHKPPNPPYCGVIGRFYGAVGSIHGANTPEDYESYVANPANPESVTNPAGLGLILTVAEGLALVALAVAGFVLAVNVSIVPYGCPEDAVLVGEGQYEDGRFERYVCGPAADDFIGPLANSR